MLACPDPVLKDKKMFFVRNQILMSLSRIGARIMFFG
jgi:hypothetical protein